MQKRPIIFEREALGLDDLISWHMAYQYGVVTTPEPAPIQTWDERVSELKDALGEYITEFKPELNNLFTE